MDLEKIRVIVAPFLNIEPAEVELSTVIDRTAVRGSVMVHRLRASLREAGVNSSSWDDVHTIGDLLGKPQNNSTETTTTGTIQKSAVPAVTARSTSKESGIGIDIESTESMPESNDYASDTFYIENFSKKEIAFCSREDNPRQCFAGRFAAKEAIYKATNGHSGRNFSTIEIYKNEDGSICSELCDISISHLKSDSQNISVAVAAHVSTANLHNVSSNLPNLPTANQSVEENAHPPKRMKGTSDLLMWLALLAITAYLIVRDFVH